MAKHLTGFRLCATIPNNTQEGVQKDATCNIEQCWESFANNVASVWRALRNHSTSSPEVDSQKATTANNYIVRQTTNLLLLIAILQIEIWFFFQKILFWLAPYELSVLTSNSVHIQKLKQSLHTLKKTPLQTLHSLVFVDTCGFRGSVHEKSCKRFPTSYAGKTSKNVSLLLLILTAKFVQESAWNTFNAKFVVGSPRNTSSSTQVRRDVV